MRIALPRTWFLAALAAVVACFGWNAFRAEEDPNDTFVQDRTESVLYLYLDAPGGTSLDSSASPAALGILLERYAWEIWRQPSTGIEEYRHAQVTPESGAMVTLTRSPETGSFADSILITGDDGRAWTTFAPGGASGAVTVQASAGESSASLCFNFSPTSSPVSEEQWSYSRTEATLTATLTSNTSTDQVPPGENRDLSLAVAYETWDVEYSSAGNSRTVNHTSAPAVGAFVSWSVAMGDGYVAGGAMTDDLGQCPATLTVGSSGGNVRAEVSFSTGSATSATLAFSPAPRPSTSSWSLIGSKLIPTLSGISPPSGTSLAPGEFARISGTLQGDVWDLWSNGTQEESRYSYTTPLAWTTLLAEIQHGGGSLDSSSPTTQGDGSFSTGYTMGGASSRVDLRLASTSEWLASVDFALSEAPPATEGSDPGAWTVLYPDGGYAIQNLTVDGPTYDLHPGEVRTIGGTLYWVSWEVMTNRDGAIEHRITSSSPVAGASLSAGMEYGDATLSSTYLTTGSLGEFSTIMTMGGQESKVTFSSSGSASATASMAFTPPQAGGDQGVKIADESLISVAFESGTAADAATLQPGENVPLRARVLSTSWEVWQNAAGSTELRNHEIRPAIGAIVNFSQVSGPGLMSSTQAETNADGIASVDFMLGAGVSLLRADASFLTATASAEARVSPGIWVYDSSQDELELSLSPHGWIETPNAIGATLQVRTTEIWRNLATEATESRQVSYSPAENASIVFNVLDGGIATFGTNPSFTNYTGNTIIEYRSNGAVNVAATATFSGKTVRATMQAPQGCGLAGTDEGGTVEGSEDNRVSNQGGDAENSGGGGNEDQPDDTSSIPTRLRGRSHHTNNPEQKSGGGSDEPEIVKMFRATFFRQRSDENNQMLPPEEEQQSGREENWISTRDQYQTDPEGTWEITDGPHFYEESLQNLVGGGDFTTYGDFGVWGKVDPAPDTDPTELASIKPATQLEELAQNGDHVDPESVNAAVRNSFENNRWDHTLREAAIGNSDGEMDDFTASASFFEGIAPTVTSTEVWLESEEPVPSDRPRPRRSFILMAKRTASIPMPPVKWYAVVTFEIANGSESPSRRVSTTTPTVTWLTTANEPPTSWVVAGANGVLRLQPEVIRGFHHEVSFLPVELKDIKDHADTSDDVTITNWETTQQIGDNNIAWIEAHTSDQNDAPRMPQLELRMPRLPQNLTLEARLLVQYERPYAGKQADDTVKIPADGSFKNVKNGRWEIWNEYTNIPFFGGDAILTYKIEGGVEQVIKFTIGGRNPNDSRCKAYTQGRPGATWYSYAIEKHESKAYNSGHYNQFWERSGNSSSINKGVNYTFTTGDPLVVRSPVETGVGGAGLAQVTGADGKKTVSSPREVFWNWQSNVDAFLVILAEKIQIAETFMNDPNPRSPTNPMPNGQRPQTTYHSGNNVPVRSRVQASVTFGDNQGEESPEDGVAIKAYNGATAHWCSWRGPSIHEWQFNDGPNNYVEAVCNQIDQEP